jgi:hypothetical protein
MLLTADSTMRIQFDCQNWLQDKTFVYILDTLHFKQDRRVLHLSTNHPLDMSAHSTMLSLMMTSQTVPNMEADTIPPHWSDLVYSSTEFASRHALNLAQAWLGSTCQYTTDLKFMDNSAIILLQL